MDSLPALALATARDGIAVGARPGSAPSVLQTIRTLLRAELSDREQAGKDVTVGYFVQPPAFASEGDSRPGARARQETYVGTFDGAPYCIQLLVGRGPAGRDEIHTWRGADGERHSDLARACRLVARHGLPGPAVTAWLRAGALRFAESTTPPPPVRGEDAAAHGTRGLRSGRRILARYRPGPAAVHGRRAGGMCRPAPLPPPERASGGPVGCTCGPRSPVGSRWGLRTGASPPPSRWRRRISSATWSASTEPSGSAVSGGRQDDVAQAFETAFGKPIGAWTASWVAAHVGTVSPGPALPRKASLGTLLALLVGALAAGAWHRRRGVGR